MTVIADPPTELDPPTDDEVAALDAWWRACLFITVGQI